MPNPGLSEDKMHEAVDAVREHGSVNRAAAAMGLARSTLQHRVKHAARHGIAPGHFEHGTAPGYLMGKVTVQRGPTGAVERVWERQSPEAGQVRAAIADALDGFRGEVERAASPTPRC